MEVTDGSGSDNVCCKECCGYLLAKLSDKKPKVAPPLSSSRYLSLLSSDYLTRISPTPTPTSYLLHQVPSLCLTLPLTLITFIYLASYFYSSPQVPSLCLEVLREATVAFGARALPVKDIIAALGPGEMEEKEEEEGPKTVH